VNVYANNGEYRYSIGTYGTRGNGEMYGPRDFIVDEENGLIFIIDFLSTIHVFGVPKMEVRETNVVASGSTYSFGQKELSSTTEKAFTIKNTGNAQLLLRHTPTITGDAASDFSIVQWSEGTIIAPGGEANFKIKFHPINGGNREAEIELFTNDGISGAFSFHLTGIVEKSSQSITFSSLPDKPYGSAPFELTATATSGLPITYASSDHEVVSISGNTVTIRKIGEVTITANQPGNGVYLAASAAQALKIVKGTQLITFSLPSGKVYGDEPFTLMGTASSGLTVVYASSDESIASVSDNTVTIHKAGVVTLTASQAGDENYLAASNEQSLIIDKANQDITFKPILSKVFGDPVFSVSAVSTSGLPVTYQSTNTSVAVVNEANVTIVGAGTVTLKASQEGNDNYKPAEPAEYTLQVGKALQQITFASIGDRTLGTAAFALSAAASSEGEVSFSTNSDKIAISETTVTLLKAGRVTVVATQEGTENYQSASAEQSFCIRPSKPTISAADLNTNSPQLISSNQEGNQWYLNGEKINGANNKVFEVAEAGVYTVKNTIDDCVSELSDPYAMVVLGLEPFVESVLELYPNPVEDSFSIRVNTPTTVKSHVRIWSSVGRLIKELEIETNRFQLIDVSVEKSGLYLIRVSVDTAVVSRSFVKK
jgi:hypothetical protein